MELRGVVRLAGEVIAKYWPMRTFIHHNPLHGLEYLPFHEAVRRGRTFLGGRGYLSGDTFRACLRSGRISLHHLDEVLRPLARDEAIIFGSCRISHQEVLRACLTHGLCAAMHEPPHTRLEKDLISSSEDEVGKLDFRHGTKPVQGHADSRADDPRALRRRSSDLKLANGLAFSGRLECNTLIDREGGFAPSECQKRPDPVAPLQRRVSLQADGWHHCREAHDSLSVATGRILLQVVHRSD